MKSRLLKYWELLRSSFWFLPTLMAGGAIALALATVALDETATNDWLQTWGLVYTGGAEGAGQVLGAIAGSMITLAGLVFSMTLVALSLAASNFGPRLLRNFMRDTANQAVLGTFVATFLYCLLVLRTIRRVDEVAFVPHLSVTMSVLLALVSIGVLIYFIHHVAVSIQADEIITRVGEELVELAERLFPRQLGLRPSGDEIARARGEVPESFMREAQPVTAGEDGYVQSIDTQALLSLADEADLLVRIERRPGDFVAAGTPVMHVWPGRNVTGQLASQLNAAVVLGNRRTAAQDVEYVIGQLVEIAVRALSPGINDPFTAIACVDRLGSALGRIVQREMPSSCRRDDRGRLRVLAPATTFAGLVDTAFDPIRRYGRASVEVSVRLLETVTAIAAFARRTEDRDVLQRHAIGIACDARAMLSNRADRRRIRKSYDAASRALRAAAA